MQELADMAQVGELSFSVSGGQKPFREPLDQCDRLREGRRRP